VPLSLDCLDPPGFKSLPRPENFGDLYMMNANSPRLQVKIIADFPDSAPE
jgi:hypothetical protein